MANDIKGEIINTRKVKGIIKSHQDSLKKQIELADRQIRS